MATQEVTLDSETAIDVTNEKVVDYARISRQPASRTTIEVVATAGSYMLVVNGKTQWVTWNKPPTMTGPATVVDRRKSSLLNLYNENLVYWSENKLRGKVAFSRNSTIMYNVRTLRGTPPEQDGNTYSVHSYTPYEITVRLPTGLWTFGNPSQERIVLEQLFGSVRMRSEFVNRLVVRPDDLAKWHRPKLTFNLKTVPDPLTRDVDLDTRNWKTEVSNPWMYGMSACFVLWVVINIAQLGSIMKDHLKK